MARYDDLVQGTRETYLDDAMAGPRQPRQPTTFGQPIPPYDAHQRPTYGGTTGPGAADQNGVGGRDSTGQFPLPPPLDLQSRGGGTTPYANPRSGPPPRTAIPRPPRGRTNPNRPATPDTPPPDTPPPPPNWSSLQGFDTGKLNDAEHTTPKYQVGRILAKYPSTPAGLQSALAEIVALFPGTTIEGSNGDKLNIPGVGVIDVGLQFSQGGNVGWAWQPVGDTDGQIDPASVADGVMNQAGFQQGMPGWYLTNSLGYGVDPGRSDLMSQILQDLEQGRLTPEQIAALREVLGPGGGL